VRKIVAREASEAMVHEHPPQPHDLRPPDRPPGEFMDERLAEDTARFLADAKRIAERRAHADAERASWERRE
jgi:hypothetical protein